jgi:NAD(P)-dependent dehydrogenase (short-subunit alcohol dehydrogenase family)
MENRIVIVTGGAQGFGEGITESMFAEGANIMIADVNSEKGKHLANSLNRRGTRNHASFSETDITDASSVQEMVFNTVVAYGGIDVLVSNAGILRAGSLEEMTPESFEAITKVNYTGYIPVY